MENQDSGQDLWPIIQRLHALAGLPKNWNGKPFDNDVLPGLGLLLADLARELMGDGG